MGKEAWSKAIFHVILPYISFTKVMSVSFKSANTKQFSSIYKASNLMEIKSMIR